MIVQIGTLALIGCSETSLHSIQDVEEPRVDRPSRHDEDEDTAAALDSADTGGLPQEEAPPEHEPEVCSLDTMVHMAGSAQDCPADHAAFMMDDGTGPNFICCPLPASDILEDVAPVERGAACSIDEVITGFSGQYSYRCTPVNTERYAVGAAQEPCYFGSGASGGSGVPGCADHPHAWDVLQQSLFGSDGCSGYPYGSLFVSQTGKDCEDMRAVQLFYTGAVEGDPAGSAVEMFR